MVCGLLEMLVLRVLIMGCGLVCDLVHILWVSKFILGVWGASYCGFIWEGGERH